MSLCFFVISCYVHDHCVSIVSQFMYIPWYHAQKQAAIRASSLQNGDSCTPSINIGSAETFDSEITEYVTGKV